MRLEATVSAADTPADAKTLFEQGTRLMQSGELAGAEACFAEALRIAPDFAEGHANFGLLLARLGQRHKAEMHCRRSLDLNPAYSQTHLNLGVLLAEDGRFDEAEAAYAQAIALNPFAPAGWSNLGVLYACNGQEAEAEHCYRKAIALDPDYAKAHFNLAYLLLRRGDFAEGWARLEWRDWYTALAAQLTAPRWQGEALAGKSILLGIEAGHGDMIQFCRYAAVLRQMGAARVGMLCHPALKTLFAGLDSVDEVIALDEPLPPSGWDYWTPPLSIPYHCGTRLDSIPAAIPYLHAAPDCVKSWAAQLPQARLRVGLVWKGNPHFENDAERSLPSLALLQPLAAVKAAGNVHFISLQKGAGEDEAMQAPGALRPVNLGPWLKDFADTAAVIMNLDLVITVDTAVAHLAGALGKPCWVLLPDFKTDWRWLRGRIDSPWYPGSMRLFRQQRAGDWEPVIAEVGEALEQFVACARQLPAH
jgi:Flp pilus assembly protein TadD